MGKLRRALGLMSGTSMDGIDAALIETDGRRVTSFGPWATVPYDSSFRDRLRAVLGGVGAVADVERELTDRHAAAVEALLAEHRIDRASIDLVGFHGQTILHRPEHEGQDAHIDDMGIEIGFRLTHVNHAREYVVLTQHCFHEAVDDILSRSAMERSTGLGPLKKALHCRRSFRMDRTCQSQIR